MEFAKENYAAMKLALIVLLATGCALAQVPADVMIQAPMQAGAIAFTTAGGPPAPIKGAPYSATITNESVQTLADGTHITQSSSGSSARDSQGRTRQDTPLPAIGGALPEDAPHLVMIQDPVAGVAYTLNITDKTAWKHVMPAGKPGMTTTDVTTRTVIVRHPEAGAASGSGIPAPPPPGVNVMWRQKFLDEHAGDITTEDLGTQVVEGIQATGTRSTETIAAGKIGNDRPISIVTEVWTSPELKTVVLSKRNDPRTGEQTFKLTNIHVGEPDASLFTVPSDFKVTDNGPETFVYRVNKQ
jgi:hypothetical protein